MVSFYTDASDANPGCLVIPDKHPGSGFSLEPNVYVAIASAYFNWHANKRNVCGIPQLEKVCLLNVLHIMPVVSRENRNIQWSVRRFLFTSPITSCTQLPQFYSVEQCCGNGTVIKWKRKRWDDMFWATVLLLLTLKRQDFFFSQKYCFLWSRYGAGTGTLTCQKS